MESLCIKPELFEIGRNTGMFARGSPRSQAICLFDLDDLYNQD